MSKPISYKVAFIVSFLLFLLPAILISRVIRFLRIGKLLVDNDDEEVGENTVNRNEAIDMHFETEGLSDKELFALRIGQLGWSRVESFKRQGDLLGAMKEQWGFDFESDVAKERALFGMKYLWSQGLVDQLIQNTHYFECFTVKDAVAYDSVQFTNFIHQIRKLELIDNDEAWGMLFLNAQRVQDCFTSWKDFGDAYTNGYLLNEAISTERDARELEMLRATLTENNDFSLQYKQLKQAEWFTTPIFDDFKVLPVEAPKTPDTE